MFERNHLAILPQSGIGFSGQLADALAQLDASVGGDHGRILTVTLFVDSGGHRDFLRKKRSAGEAMIRAGITSPWSFVAQPPEAPYTVSLYAETLPFQSRVLEVKRKHLAGIPYSVIQWGKDREVIAAGLTAGHRRRTTAGRSDAAFALALRILKGEGLSAGNIVRQWNYLEDLLGVRRTPYGRRQNYQEFNDRRRAFYESSSFPAGYPAATGIGADEGGVTLDFRALVPRRGLRIVALSNPLQQDAHRYSQDVLVGDSGGHLPPKASPLFERAKFIGDGLSGTIYISGTAAIREQATVAAADAAMQTRITIDNIRRLISADNLRRHGLEAIGETGPLSYLRAYVRRGRDMAEVRSICRRTFGDVPAHFIRADICRNGLLMELEGVVRVELKGKPRGKERRDDVSNA